MYLMPVSYSRKRMKMAGYWSVGSAHSPKVLRKREGTLWGPSLSFITKVPFWNTFPSGKKTLSILGREPKRTSAVAMFPSR